MVFYKEFFNKQKDIMDWLCGKYIEIRWIHKPNNEPICFYIQKKHKRIENFVRRKLRNIYIKHLTYNNI